jgi:hypothetical protein
LITFDERICQAHDNQGLDPAMHEAGLGPTVAGDWLARESRP